MEASSRQLVATLALFRGMTPAALDTVLAEARIVRFQEGESIFTQGELAGSFFLLAQGRVKINQLTPAGRQVVLVIVSPGEFFGLAAGIGRATYPGTAVAVMAGQAVAWPSAAWDRLVANHPELTRTAMQIMGRRIMEMQTRLREMSTERVEQRIAHTLLRLVRQSGRPIAAGTVVEFPVSRQDIAEMTGTTLYTVSRTLSAWEQSGILVGGRRRIVVRDAHALVRIADD